jgi:hypothetical protein
LHSACRRFGKVVAPSRVLSRHANDEGLSFARCRACGAVTGEEVSPARWVGAPRPWTPRYGFAFTRLNSSRISCNWRACVSAWPA